MKNPLTEEQFLEEVKDHQLTVVKDDGIHRHIILGKPGTINRRFEIITFPGYLVYVGDMGSYIFRRLDDMFEFFRGPWINTGYWGEKLQAVDRHDGYHQYSENKLREHVKDDFDNWDWDNFSSVQKDEAWSNLEDEMSFWDLNSVDLALTNVMNYTCPITKNDFVDFWDHDFNEYTYYYVWCCYALRWAIGKYDEAKLDA